MGNDGGSIPTRRELVKSAARNPTHSEVRSSQASTREYRWSTCPLSKKRLASPVVSDSAGILYNKDSIIEWLLRGTEAYGDGEEVLQGRVKSLKDVVEVKFDGVDEKWVCPVSRKELGPGTKAVYIVPCGHAFAESAVREVGTVENGCLVCGASYEELNVVAINPTEPAEVEKLQERIKTLHEKSLTHALKKLSEKKSKKRKNNGGGGVEEDSSKPAKKPKEDESGGLRNSAAAALTNKVMEDEKLKHEQRKLQMSDNVKTLFSKNDGGKNTTGKNTDFMSRGYTLPPHVQR